MSNLISYGFLTPPAVLISLCLAGAWLTLYRPRAGILVSLVAASTLYVCATPIVGTYLLQRIEAKAAGGAVPGEAKAIVVLGGDIRVGDGAKVPDTLGPSSLERVAYAARAYRQLHLPVLVSGGRIRGSQASVGGLMKAALEDQFAVPVAWTEDRSETTYENAVYSARILNGADIGTVVVVTHAWHMPRSLWSFDRAGLRALPWPAPRHHLRVNRIDDFLPNIGALHDTFLTFHELIGNAYYRLHY